MIVHIGQWLSSGHYVTVVRAFDEWFLLNDDQIQPIGYQELRLFFGMAWPLPTRLLVRGKPGSELVGVEDAATRPYEKGTSYILLYERTDE
jgi:hypothetical protein